MVPGSIPKIMVGLFFGTPNSFFCLIIEVTLRIEQKY
jgi:hypothetical protein